MNCSSPTENPIWQNKNFEWVNKKNPKKKTIIKTNWDYYSITCRTKRTKRKIKAKLWKEMEIWVSLSSKERILKVKKLRRTSHWFCVSMNTSKKIKKRRYNIFKGSWKLEVGNHWRSLQPWALNCLCQHSM